MRPSHSTPSPPAAPRPPRGQVEESRLRGDGSKVVTKQGRQSLARVSALDGRHSGSEGNAIVMMDDYVVQSEPVVDHLTRFSGLRPGRFRVCLIVL